MTYEKALEWIEANKKLIGTETEKGMYIGDLVAVPVNLTERENFLRTYVLNRGKNASIIPVRGDDFSVWGIDTNRLTPNGVLLYKILAD